MIYPSFLVLFKIILQLCEGQNSHTEHEHGWDIRLSIPGEPGQDYPTLSEIPKTSFSCSGKEPGYYADVETNCQVFRVCALGINYGFQSFLCPNGTVFNQEVAVCDWWMNVNCEKSELYFNNNLEKFNKLRLGSQMMNDVNVMLTRTIGDSHNRAEADNYVELRQSLSKPSLQNGVLLRNSEENLNSEYIPPKRKMSYIKSRTNDVMASSSTSRPQYLLTDSENFEFKQTSPQTLKTQRVNGHTQIVASTNRMIKNRIPAKLTDTSSTTYLKRHYDNFIEQQNYRNYIDRSNQSKNKEKSMQILHDYKANQKELSPQEFPLLLKSSNLNRLIEKSKPSSRVTFKSWILSPTKSAKLILESTPHTPVTAKKTSSFAKFIFNSPNYSAPDDLSKSQTGYTYNKPAVDTLSRIRFSPNFTFSHHTSSHISPPRSYLTPANLKSTSPIPLYLTPSKKNSTPHSQLSSSYRSHSIRSRNEKLHATSTSPAPIYIPPTYSFSTIKQPQPNSNFDKLSFANTRKEKLSDNFSNDINQNTIKTLIHSDQLKIIKQNKKEFNSPEDWYSGLLNPVNVESSKYILSPSTELQPPFQTIRIHKNKTNELSTLPYFKEIEVNPAKATKKIVNLKFSLPKEIVAYLHQTKNKNSFDKLQILDLGMQHYLVLTNDNVLTNSTSSKFIPLGKLIYEESSRTPTNIDDEQEFFSNENRYIVGDEHQNIDNEDLTDITNKISDLTSSQFSENETPNVSKELKTQTSSPKGTNATNIFFITKNVIPNHFSSNLIREQLYSGELYNYPVPDVSQLILDEENSINRYVTKNDQEHTKISDLSENIFQTPQILEEKSSTETEVTDHDNQFTSKGLPSELQVDPNSNVEFNHSKVDSYGPVHYYDSLKSSKMGGNLLKTKSNTAHSTSLDKLNIKEKVNDLSESELYERNLLHSSTGREIEIRLIPSISWRIEKEEDIKELLHLLKNKKIGQHSNDLLNKEELHNEDQINYFNSEIDYTVDHSSTRDKDKGNYKVSSGTYTGPSSYLVAQSSIGSLEPYRDQLMKPNITLGYDNHKPARIEDLDESNGYQKVSPLPPFTF